MNNHKTRRVGALVLALALALSLAAPAAGIGYVEIHKESGDGSLSGGKLTLTVGNEVTLVAVPDTSAVDEKVNYEWSIEKDETPLTEDFVACTFDEGGKKINIKAKGAVKGAVITVTATGSNNVLRAQCDLTIEEKTTTSDPDPITLNKPSLTLEVGKSETLTVSPAGTEVTWSTSDSKVATVDRGTVKAVGEGTATITAKAGDKTATCAVTVGKPSVTGLSFSRSGQTIRWNDRRPWELTVITNPLGAEMGDDDKIEWDVVNQSNTSADEKTWPTYDYVAGSKGKTIRVTDEAPGDYIFTAKYMGMTAQLNVHVSGILLNEEKVKMLVGGSQVLVVDKSYGDAASSSATDVVWTSSDPATVSVSSNGELLAWKLGTAIITANKNGYTATCEVTVGEDEDVIAYGPYHATTGSPLILMEAADELDTISQRKSGERDSNGDYIGGTGSPLNYITNVSVPTSQGALYYNYDSPANTGEGVSGTTRFARRANGSILGLDRLYFVPRQGFTGTAEITFNGWSLNGTSFSGIIRVQVTGVNKISYRTHVGEPVFFISDDFNTYCRDITGRDLNYITFNLPQTTQGTLYYNYSSASRPGDRVPGSTQYSRSGRYTIEKVCFAPHAAFLGTAAITFRGVDTAGQSFTGEIAIIVSDSGSRETANVYVSAQRGQPATLRPDLFNDACQATIRDTLSYVTFKLPAYNEGTLYYNYQGAGNPGTRVAAGTRYNYSGVPGISGVAFVPASNSTGRVAVSYTGYGKGGASFSGTIFISIGDTERATVRYFVSKNSVIVFDPNDFNSAALLQMGVSVEYVKFHLPDRIALGELYYDYQGDWYYNSGVYSDFEYYRNPKLSYQGQLGLISFHAGASAGTVSIPYTAYGAAENAAGERETFTGSVVIQIGSPSPEDVKASIDKSGQLWLSSHILAGACDPVMDKDLAYIEITGLPPTQVGRLYSSYLGFKTGTQVKRGDRFYCMGAPGIDQVSFIPYGGFTGEAEITYIGFSSDGQELVSGRVMVTVTDSPGSQYFNDMANHRWAADAVDFLYRNETVQGVGENKFNPTGNLSKGDFTLMLVRAFGFTADRTVTYADVPAGSYYAKAISIASQLGIVGGSGGNFSPKETLSRQDAMLMVYNALQADGRQLTNGLAADLRGYHDEEQIASYAREAVGCLVQMGIVKGDGNGYLNPQKQLNRAEAAILLHAVMTL